MATKQDVGKVLGLLCTAYPNFDLPDITARLYVRYLKDFTSELLESAALQCIDKSRFFPTIAELRSAATQIRIQIAKVPSSLEAWQEVRMQIINVGYTGSPFFTHPFIEKAVGLLGWRNLCASENQTADRSRFVQAYEQIIENVMNEEMMIPEVRRYIETNSDNEKILALTEKLSKKNERIIQKANMK